MGNFDSLNESLMNGWEKYGKYELNMPKGNCQDVSIGSAEEGIFVHDPN